MSRVPFGLGYPPDVVLRAMSAVELMRAAPNNRHELELDGMTPKERSTLEGLAREPGMRAAFLAEQAFSSSPREAHAAGGLATAH